MKKKQNLLLLILAVLFVSLFGGSTAVSAASSFPRLQAVSSGEIVSKNNNLYYRYGQRNYARNKYLRIKGKNYYFDSSGKAWYGMHTINGRKYYFGTRSEGYMYRSRLFRYNKNYYYANQKGILVTSGWYTLPSGKKYYFDSAGRAYTGKRTINKTTYYFDSNGSLNHSGLYYDLASDCALLINADTGKVLYAKNENLRHANASTTKIMTCILALENSKMNETVKFSARATALEPTKLYARTGETFYMRDLLYSLMVPSHNDTAAAIAEHISGSQSKFVSLMNKKAAQLGCTDTHFACHFLPARHGKPKAEIPYPNIYDLYRYKEVLYIDSTDHVLDAKRSFSAMLASYIKYFKVCKLIDQRYDKVCEQYRNMFGTFISQDFWNHYLDLDKKKDL